MLGIKDILKYILLADDDDGIRKFGRKILEHHGYLVLEAAHPDVALNLVEEHSGRIHLLLTDLIMPDMTGRQLAEMVKRNSPEIKVLYTSGYRDVAIGIKAALPPEANYISKPFTGPQLISAVQSVW